MSRSVQRLALAASVLCMASLANAGPTQLAALRARPPQDEVVYFLLPDRFQNGDPANDRGGLSGDRSRTGFDPTDKAFYHGGDLKGVIQRLDYIQGLGATAIWITPVFRNKPVQGPPGHESASYHGYWITDFTDVDPHLGTKADFAALVAAAHARGMKVYLDIVVNHTADVIKYRECPDSPCPYRSVADYPYTRRGGVDGPPINDGFLGADPAHRTAENFARLTSPDWAYTPYVPAAEANEKAPAWLNNPIYYHNRGDSTFRGESSELGDFGGLDDLFTENPRVVSGFIDIYSRWIDEFAFDGYRIDTARHVDPEFWQAFVPAIKARAAARGIPNFYIFGEVATDLFDPAQIARHTRVDKLPQVLDFGFQTAVRDTVAGSAGTDELATLFFDDALYEGGEATAIRHPTFVSNHDAGRFAWFARRANPKAPDSEILKRVELAYGMLFALRGVPIIYYGDEQGFAGAGGDQSARQDMFPSKVAEYNAEPLVGTTRTTAEDNFNPDHPLYRAIAALARMRAATPALREGRQVTRFSDNKPGLFAVSRFDPKTGAEVVAAFNTSKAPLTAQVLVGSTARRFSSLHGRCAPVVSAPGSYKVTLAPLDYVVCGEVR